MPAHKAFGYVRVSGDAQAESGVGQDAQVAKIEQHYRKAMAADYAWGGVIQDPATSGSTHFLKRKGGGELNRELKVGDCVIFAKLDRAFRRLVDCLQMVEQWTQRGVKIVFLDIRGEVFDSTTFQGKLMLFMLGFVAEIEWDRSVQRAQDRTQTLRRQGRAHGTDMIGFERVGDGHGRQFIIPNYAERAVAAWAARQIEQSGQSIYVLRRWMEDNGMVNPRTKKPFTYDTLRNWINSHTALAAEEARLGVDNVDTFYIPPDRVVRLADWPAKVREQVRLRVEAAAAHAKSS